MNISQYRYVIFDADHTVIDFDADEKRAFRAAFSAVGIPVSEEAIGELWRFSAENWGRLGLYNVHLPEIQSGYHALYDTHVRELFDHAAERYGLQAHREVAQREFERVLALPSHPIEGAVEVIRALAERYRICIATNGLIRLQRGRLSALSPYIHRVFISEEIGTIKPCGEFFSAMLRSLGAKAEECVLVGDSLDSDIAGANLAGMDAIWFNRRHRPLPSGVTVAAQIDSLTQLLSLL